MKPRTSLLSGCMLLGVSVMLLLAHVRTVVAVRDVSVPLIAQIPQLERTERMLQEQSELAELHAATRVGSLEETIDMFVLPEKTDIARLIASFEILRDSLKYRGLLARMSEISISEEDDIHMSFAVNEEGMTHVLGFLRLAGLLTIGDALTEDEVALLVSAIERENPAGIIALEQFLSADILRYAQDSKAYEEQLKRSFSTDAVLAAVENVLRTSLLRDARTVLQGDIGSKLERYKLWPVQMLVLETIELRPGGAEGWYTVEVRLGVGG